MIERTDGTLIFTIARCRAGRIYLADEGILMLVVVNEGKMYVSFVRIVVGGRI